MKKFYKENRVFAILMMVVIVCIIIMGIFLLSYFYKGNDKGRYGDRLDGLKTVEMTKSKISDLIDKIKENKQMENVVINVHGKIIYTTLEVKEGTSLDVGKGIALKSIELYSEDFTSYYDYQFLLKENKEDGYVIIGAKSKNNSNIVWNNNKDSEEKK